MMRTLKGCWWQLVTLGTLLFLIGLTLVYPWLIIPTILIGIVYFILVIAKRRLNP